MVNCWSRHCVAFRQLWRRQDRLRPLQNRSVPGKYLQSLWWQVTGKTRSRRVMKRSFVFVLLFWNLFPQVMQLCSVLVSRGNWSFPFLMCDKTSSLVLPYRPNGMRPVCGICLVTYTNLLFQQALKSGCTSIGFSEPVLTVMCHSICAFCCYILFQGQNSASPCSET
jgi:hypothetical protein